MTNPQSTASNSSAQPSSAPSAQTGIKEDMQLISKIMREQKQLRKRRLLEKAKMDRELAQIAMQRAEALSRKQRSQQIFKIAAASLGALLIAVAVSVGHQAQLPMIADELAKRDVYWQQYVQHVRNSGSDIKCSAGQLLTQQDTCFTPGARRVEHVNPENLAEYITTGSNAR